MKWRETTNDKIKPVSQLSMKKRAANNNLNASNSSILLHFSLSLTLFLLLRHNNFNQIESLSFFLISFFSWFLFYFLFLCREYSLAFFPSPHTHKIFLISLLFFPSRSFFSSLSLSLIRQQSLDFSFSNLIHT